MSSDSITVSIVSHGQGRLTAALLEDLARCPSVSAVILTLNIPEDDILCPEQLRSRLRLIRNGHPIGFGANHNQAFRFCETKLFAVLNPDIRLANDPFPELVIALKKTHGGVIAPTVRYPDGGLEDSARHFPTVPSLLRKLMGLGDGRVVIKGAEPQDVDWTAGMFLLFPTRVFSELNGFDEGFFLYYEDVDICTRLWKSGERVILHPGVVVIHAAQRASRRNLRYMKWHLTSMARYLGKYSLRLPR
ncbi:glycosyltransferase [Rhizobium etli]|uniref:glycosyltransferase n=1 Tax=Rhizobium etli TaxID=29449 RepID=UPI0003839787|nr:glycosyltransferase [Rhizobium etli]AGS20641.1 glycosyltransferase family 2 protein [Rhizobium etli bv. mimosae str. Mim1]